MEIRRVNKNDDFTAIGNIYAESWKTAYKGIVPQDYLDSLSGSRWYDMLVNDTDSLFVAADGNRYAAVSSVCAARDESITGYGEIISIYLLPEYFGKGLGKSLFDFSIRALNEMGYKNIYLWVLEENTRARRFYEKNGFHRSGDSAEISVGGKRLTEIRYVNYKE